MGKIIDSLVLGFEKTFEIGPIPDQLTREEVKLPRELREVKYSTTNWNYRRIRMSCRNRLAFLFVFDAFYLIDMGLCHMSGQSPFAASNNYLF